MFKHQPRQSQCAAHTRAHPCLSSSSSGASVFTTSHYAELRAALSLRLGQKCKQIQNFTECHEAPAEWFVWTEILLHFCSSWVWLSRCPLWILMGLGVQKGAALVFRHSTNYLNRFSFFPPPLSYLMMLFKNMRGQAKSLKEGSLPTFNKN